jgi:hypothetical protein
MANPTSLPMGGLFACAHYGDDNGDFYGTPLAAITSDFHSLTAMTVYSLPLHHRRYSIRWKSGSYFKRASAWARPVGFGPMSRLCVMVIVNIERSLGLPIDHPVGSFLDNEIVFISQTIMQRFIWDDLCKTFPNPAHVPARALIPYI